MRQPAKHEQQQYATAKTACFGKVIFVFALSLSLLWSTSPTANTHTHTHPFVLLQQLGNAYKCTLLHTIPISELCKGVMLKEIIHFVLFMCLCMCVYLFV